jgi:transposase-like protein
MKTTTLSQEQECPVCKHRGNQSKKGFNRSGTQRCICRKCGATGRGVGRLFGMSKANVYN